MKNTENDASKENDESRHYWAANACSCPSCKLGL